MFIVKHMAISTTKWDDKDMAFKDVDPFLYNPCGSSHTQHIHLKTLGGVLNRIERYRLDKMNDGTKELHIFKAGENGKDVLVKRIIV